MDRRLHARRPRVGRYLGRDAPELTALGLRVAGVAGAAPPPRRGARARRRGAGRAARAAAATAANEHDPNAIAVLAAASRCGWVPRELAEELAAISTPAGRGRRSCCASSGCHRATRATGSRCCSPRTPGSSSALDVSSRHMASEHPDLIAPDETAFRLELTPAQLKVTHSALRALLSDFGHDQPDVHRVIREGARQAAPSEASIRSIDLAAETASPLTVGGRSMTSISTSAVAGERLGRRSPRSVRARPPQGRASRASALAVGEGGVAKVAGEPRARASTVMSGGVRRRGANVSRTR